MATVAPKAGKKIVDVAGPETTTPSSSSRPIIVQNRGTLTRDPMVSSGDVAGAPAVSADKIINHQAQMVAPLPAQSGTKLAETETPATPEVDTKATAKVAETDTTLVADDPTTTEAPERHETADEHARSDEATDATATAKETKKADADSAKRQAELEAIIEKGTYAVPINAVGRKRSRNLALLLMLLAVVLVVVAGDALLDMGTIQLSGIPHTHILKK